MRVLILVLLLLTCELSAQPLVVISIDGFNPEFYQQGSEFHAPTLKQLASSGARARAVYPVFPSITYPNHTALATGCRSARHGVHTNIKVGRKEWYWYDTEIAVPTLWQLAKQHGKTVALLSWPVAVGAAVDFNVPEIFHVSGVTPQTTEELIRSHTTEGLFERFRIVVPESFAAWDRETEKVAVGLLKEEAIDLMMIHILQLDKAQHSYGPRHPEVQKALSEVDGIVGSIAQAAGPQATVVVLGDHGFLPYTRPVYLQGMLEHAGLADQAVVKSTGGSAAVYTESDRVRALFTKELPSVDRVLRRAELDQLEAFPGADFALVAAPGYAFDWKADGPERTEHTRGQHGHLPESVPTGFMMVGPGIQPGTDLGSFPILNVAPTLAELLGFPMPTAQGRSVLPTFSRTWFR